MFGPFLEKNMSQCIYYSSHACLSVCLSVCVCVSVCLSVCHYFLLVPSDLWGQGRFTGANKSQLKIFHAGARINPTTVDDRLSITVP